MKIASLFSEKTVFSFEIFPPKKTSPIETVYDTLEALQDLKPDFISVTFGAGGSGNGENTLAIARRLKEHYGVLPMAHLPCIHYTKEQIDNILKQFQENGIENVLALRGDRVEGMEPAMDFVHAATSSAISAVSAGSTLPEPAIRSVTPKLPTWTRTSVT